MAKNAKTSTETAGTDNDGKWYVRNESTKKVAPSADTAKIDAEIDQINKSSLPATVKAAAIAGLRAAQASAKPFALTICNARKEGAMDLIEVSGGFKSKMLSPNVVAAIAENAAFAAKFVADFRAAD